MRFFGRFAYMELHRTYFLPSPLYFKVRISRRTLWIMQREKSFGLNSLAVNAVFACYMEACLCVFKVILTA